jgi:hypothetical protein
MRGHGAIPKLRECYEKLLLVFSSTIFAVFVVASIMSMIHFSESNDVASFVICWSAFEDSISIVGLCPKSPEASGLGSRIFIGIFHAAVGLRFDLVTTVLQLLFIE